MHYSDEITKEATKLARRRAVAERKIEKALEKGVDRYRKRYTRFRKKGERPMCILAEGDSWFRYGAGYGIIYYLERLMEAEILNLAKPGDEARAMLTGGQHKRLARELRRGPSRNMKYDALLFSGGGNDLVGKETFHLWVNDYVSGMTAEELINTSALKPKLDEVETAYRELISLRDTNSKNTPIFLHGYDFAHPTGVGVCGMGPWLQPGLQIRKVPVKLRKEVVQVFLTMFAARLKKLQRNEHEIHIVPTQGTLQTKSQWGNEIHPTNKEFKTMAKKFRDEIKRVVV